MRSRGLKKRGLGNGYKRKGVGEWRVEGIGNLGFRRGRGSPRRR